MNRKRFFDNYAADHSFDPLVAANWYEGILKVGEGKGNRRGKIKVGGGLARGKRKAKGGGAYEEDGKGGEREKCTRKKPRRETA
jgi:hypothetical protein